MARRRKHFAIVLPLGAGVICGAAGLGFPAWGPLLFAIGALMAACPIAYLWLRPLPSIAVGIVLGGLAFALAKYYEPPPVYPGPKFSETQRIKVLPPSLGGAYALNVAFLATMTVVPPYDSSFVTLRVDPTVQGYPPLPPEFKVDGVVGVYGNNKVYRFDSHENKRHEIEIGGRRFIVALEGVNILDMRDVATPYEYIFNISEK